jgi:hypothetical protein
METQEIINKTQYPDSCEFGTPSRGVWKAYYNVGNMEEAEVRIDNAIELFKRAKEKDAKARGDD